MKPINISFALLCLVLLAACSGTQKGPGITNPYQTEAAFCAAWANAACNATVVQDCAAADAKACQTAQANFCQHLVPTGYNSKNAAQCIDAVKAAYKDGKLTRTEYETVRNLGAPCDELIEGSGHAGDSCSTRYDCDTLLGLDCIATVSAPGDAGADAGTDAGTTPSGVCEVPNLVQPGEDCSAPADVCTPGYYCSNSHCIASGKVGASCSATSPCGSGLNCSKAGTCVAKSGLNGPCAGDNTDCQDTLLCVTAGGSTGVCVAEDQLAPSDPVCLDLR